MSANKTVQMSVESLKDLIKNATEREQGKTVKNIYFDIERVWDDGPDEIIEVLKGVNIELNP